MASQRTLAFIKVWEKCLNSSKEWERNDIFDLDIEHRVGCFGTETPISSYWEWCLWFSDFVECIDVKLFTEQLTPEIAEKAGFPGLGVIIEEHSPSGNFIFKDFHPTLESVLHHPRKWAAAYAEVNRKRGYGMNSIDVFIPDEYWEDGNNLKKWETFKLKAISAYLLKYDPTDEEWNKFFSRASNDNPQKMFSVQTIEGKVKLAMLSSTFETRPSDVMIIEKENIPWFDVVEIPK
jgi:hypothetical protein